MKILIVHNDYGRNSGEEAVVDQMGQMFRRMGHQVCFFRRSTADSRTSLSGKVSVFLNGIYAPGGVRGLREALLREKPDVVHVHNVYPFVSPAALFECRRAGVPVVMTVHNYRLFCPTGLLMRHGEPCRLCLTRGSELSCVVHNCERSLPKSLAYAARNAVARHTGAFRKCVGRMVCLTSFQRDLLVEAGFDAGRLTVIPNFVDVPDAYTATLGHYVAYVGRLSQEKGYDLLFEVARRHPEMEFRFAGAAGEMCPPDLPANVRLLGHLDREALTAFIRDSRFVVVPSRCYEGFPLAILECACQGKPAVGPRHGGFTEVIGEDADASGLLFQPGSVDDLERQVVWLWQHPGQCACLGRRAFSKLQTRYSSEVVARQWSALLSEIRAVP